MDITWLGHACFRVRSKDATIITDPFDRSVGNMGKVTADIVTISHNHPAHSFLEGVTGTPKVVEGPGEYEVSGVFITGLRTYHDGNKGQERGMNAVYLMELEELVVCHLGDLGHVPLAAQVERIGNVDVLLVPVGGGSTIGAAQAAETVRLLEPKVIIPMHFHSERTPDLAPLEQFLKEMGVSEFTAQPRLTITKASLPQTSQVMVLEART